jgi:hypothetical protein
MGKTRTATTPEQRQARYAADAALIEAASARLDGDEAGDDLAEFITGRPALARLSVKNCALLAEQAEMRGTDVSDVRTFAGWRTVGRQVKKGSKAYQLTVPRRDEETKAEAGAEASKPEPEGKEKKPRFFLKAAWFDIAQTEPVEFTEPTSE